MEVRYVKVVFHTNLLVLNVNLARLKNVILYIEDLLKRNSFKRWEPKNNGLLRKKRNQRGDSKAKRNKDG